MCVVGRIKFLLGDAGRTVGMPGALETLQSTCCSSCHFIPYVAPENWLRTLSATLGNAAQRRYCVPRVVQVVRPGAEVLSAPLPPMRGSQGLASGLSRSVSPVLTLSLLRGLWAANPSVSGDVSMV